MYSSFIFITRQGIIDLAIIRNRAGNKARTGKALTGKALTGKALAGKARNTLLEERIR